MSKLNFSASEFVPRFKVPAPAPAQPTPPLAPIERPEQTEAPPPPPTISSSIGGSKPTPPPPAPSSGAATPTKTEAPSETSRPPPPPPSSGGKSSAPAPSQSSSGSKTFTMDRAKNDADQIQQHVNEAVDEDTLKDLYGDLTTAKQHLNIVFIGHVDAGKSTMGGNILFLTGTVDKRTMEKYEREAKEAGRETWYISWALDSTAQERAKGKTVEVGRGYFETDTRRYTILDAPGHKNFVPAMISSGAAQADVAVLVISSRKGEFETGFEKGGQTQEHAKLVKIAGVQRLVVAINKMDDITVNWDKARYDEIINKLTRFLKVTGFNPKDVTYIPVSAQTGLNLKDRMGKQVCPWWDGPSLLEYLDKMPMLNRKLDGPLIMPISEKYKDMGTMVVGKLEAGHLRLHQELLLMPNRTQVEVTGIYFGEGESEEELDKAICGDNVRLRLKGVDDEDISPGFVLTSRSAGHVHAVRQFEAQLVILENKNIICAGYSAVMHVHTLAEEITLVALLHYYDKATGRKSKKPPQFAKKGQKIVALIETEELICIERFADHPQMGRFTIRDEGMTVAIGKVTKLVENPVDLSENMANLALNGPQAVPTS